MEIKVNNKSLYRAYKNIEEFMKGSMRSDAKCYYSEYDGEEHEWSVTIDSYGDIMLMLFDEDDEYKGHEFLTLQRFFETCRWKNGEYCGVLVNSPEYIRTKEIAANAFCNTCICNGACIFKKESIGNKVDRCTQFRVFIQNYHNEYYS